MKTDALRRSIVLMTDALRRSIVLMDVLRESRGTSASHETNARILERVEIYDEDLVPEERTLCGRLWWRTWADEYDARKLRAGAFDSYVLTYDALREARRAPGWLHSSDDAHLSRLTHLWSALPEPDRRLLDRLPVALAMPKDYDVIRRLVALDGPVTIYRMGCEPVIIEVNDDMNVEALVRRASDLFDRFSGPAVLRLGREILPWGRNATMYRGLELWLDDQP